MIINNNIIHSDLCDVKLQLDDYIRGVKFNSSLEVHE